MFKNIKKIVRSNLWVNLESKGVPRFLGNKCAVRHDRLSFLLWDLEKGYSYVGH